MKYLMYGALLATICCVAGCGDGAVLTRQEFVQDAKQGAALCPISPESRTARILFVPTSGFYPKTGGERNMAFLTLAAQYLGFDTACYTNRELGLALLEDHGVATFTDDDESLRAIPQRLPWLMVENFENSLASWDLEPASFVAREEVVKSFERIEKWLLEPQASEKEFSKQVSSIERVLVRSLRLKSLLVTHPVDVVVADGTHEALTSLLAGLSTHQRVLLYAQSAGSAPYDAIFGAEVEIMAVSQAAARRFSPQSKVTIVENGINFRRFSPRVKTSHKLREEIGVRDTDFLIGHTGYLHPGKNQLGLLRAAIKVADSVPNIHVVFVGEVGHPNDMYGDELIRESARHAFTSHVHYLGTRNDVDDILKELDLYVFPSLDEGFGLGLAEAMASEVPAIASDLPAFRGFVGDTIQLVPLENGDSALAEAILRVIRDPVAARNQAKRSRRQLVLRGLDTDRMVRDFAALIGAKIEEHTTETRSDMIDTIAPSLAGIRSQRDGLSL